MRHGVGGRLRKLQCERGVGGDSAAGGDGGGQSSVLIYGDGRWIHGIDGEVGVHVFVYAGSDYRGARAESSDGNMSHGWKLRVINGRFDDHNSDVHGTTTIEIPESNSNADIYGNGGCES